MISLWTPVQRFLVVGDLDRENLRGVEEPVGVVFEPENGGAMFRLVGANSLEAAKSIVQGVGKDVHFGFAPRHVLAVHSR